MGGRYIGRKVAGAIVTILAIVVLNFLLFRAMPGSPERILFRNPLLTQEARQELRERWGLDRPLIPDQLVAYLVATANLDLGTSFKFQNKSVGEVIGSRVWPTVILFGLAEVIAIVVGLALGAYTGWRRGGPVDLVGNGVSLILYAIPYFLIGMVLLIVFATWLGWFPTSGMLTVGARFQSFPEQLLDFAGHLVLPLTAAAIGLIGQYSILMRASIIETLDEDYVTTARAKGIGDRRVLRSHAFPNALLPSVTLIAINLGYIVGGAIALEEVFNWPGLGTLTVTAVDSRDYPLLQGIFLLLSVSVVLANLVADIVYGRLDPRVRV
jgi:peptide/nickel transport system permease protein